MGSPPGVADEAEVETMGPGQDCHTGVQPNGWTNEKRPRLGPRGRRRGGARYAVPWKVNLPRSVFLNRAAFPLALISLRIAA
jgi:hypothetical protein